MKCRAPKAERIARGRVLAVVFATIALPFCFGARSAFGNLEVKTARHVLIDKDDEISIYFPKRTSNFSQVFPVVWYSFGDSEYVPARDNQLLEDVSDAGRVLVVASFKNPAAWEAFGHLEKGIKALDGFRINGKKIRFRRRLCLLATGKSAASHLAFALKNPDRVSCLANIHPELKSFQKIEQLVRLRIPLLHIHGTGDEVNAYQQERDFVSRYLSAGGDMTLITEWDNRHGIPTIHEYGSQALTRFLIQHTFK